MFAASWRVATHVPVIGTTAARCRLGEGFTRGCRSLGGPLGSLRAMNKPFSAAFIAAVALAVGAPAASAQTREYEGTVVSVDRDSRSFRLHDSERGTVRVRVTSRTRFERINGLAGLRAGQRNIETIVRRSNGRWVALEVERSGGGGNHDG
jgi:hypothetical protein